jgi:CARDB
MKQNRQLSLLRHFLLSAIVLFQCFLTANAQGIIPLYFKSGLTGHSAVIIVEPTGVKNSFGQPLAKVTLTEALGIDRPARENVIVNQYTLTLTENGRLDPASINYLRNNILGESRISGGVSGYWIDVDLATTQKMTGYAYDVQSGRVPFEYKFLSCNCANYVSQVIRKDGWLNAQLETTITGNSLGRVPLSPGRLDFSILELWKNQIGWSVIFNPRSLLEASEKGYSRIYGIDVTKTYIPPAYYGNPHWYFEIDRGKGFDVNKANLKGNLGGNVNEPYTFYFKDDVTSVYNFQAYDASNLQFANFDFLNTNGTFSYSATSRPVASFKLTDASGFSKLFNLNTGGIGAVDFRNIDVQAIDIDNATKSVNFILAANNTGTAATTNINTQNTLLKKVFLQTLAIPNDKQVISLDILDNPTRGFANADATFKNTDVCRFFYEADAQMKADLLYSSLSGNGGLNQGITADWIALVKASPYYLAWISKNIDLAYKLKARFIITPDFTDANKGGSKMYITNSKFKIDRFVDNISMNLSQPGLTVAEITDLQNRLNDLRTKVFQRLDNGIATVLPRLNAGLGQYKNLRSVLWAIVAAHWYKTADIANKPYASLINSNNLTGITTSTPFNQPYWDQQAYRLLGVERFTNLNNQAIDQNFFGGTEIKSVGVDRFLTGLDTNKVKVISNLNTINYVNTNGNYLINSGSVPVSLPELKINKLKINDNNLPDPGSVLARKPFSIDVTVGNSGNAAASNVKLFLYDDEIRADGSLIYSKSTTLIGNTTIATLSGGGAFTTINFPVTINTPGQHRFRVAVNKSDDGLTVPANEQIVDNNTYERMLFLDSDQPEMDDESFPGDFTTIIPTVTTLKGTLQKGQDSLYNFTWTSNLNGVLGNARIVNVNLTPGNQVLKFQVKNKTTNALIKEFTFNVRAINSKIKFTRNKNPFSARVIDKMFVPVKKGFTVNNTSAVTFRAAAAPLTATSQPTGKTGGFNLLLKNVNNGNYPAYPPAKVFAGHHEFLRVALSDNYVLDPVTVTAPVNIREFMNLDISAITFNTYHKLLQTGKDFTVRYEIYTPAGALALAQNVNITGLTTQTNVWVPFSISGLTGDGIWRVVIKSKYATDAAFLDDGSFSFVKNMSIGVANISRYVLDTVPINGSTLISPNDNRVYFLVRLDNVPEGMDVRWEWYTPSGTLYSTYQSSFPDPEGKQYQNVYLTSFIDVKGKNAEAFRGNWQPVFYLKRLGSRSATWKRYNGSFTLSNNVFNVQADIGQNGTKEINVSGVYNFTTNLTNNTEFNNYVAAVTGTVDTVWVPLVNEFSQGGSMSYQVAMNYSNGTTFTDGPYGIDSTNALYGRFATLEAEDAGKGEIIPVTKYEPAAFDRSKNLEDPNVYAVNGKGGDIEAPRPKSLFEDKPIRPLVNTLPDTRLYPNPAGNESSLFLTMKDDDNVTVELIRPTGDRIKVLISSVRLPRGYQVLPVNLSGLPIGTYLLKISYGKKTAEILKLVKMKM